MPAGKKESKLTMILESARVTGVTGVSVERVEFLTEDHSQALVTLCSPEGTFTTTATLACFNSLVCSFRSFTLHSSTSNGFLCLTIVKTPYRNRIECPEHCNKPRHDDISCYHAVYCGCGARG